MTRLNYIISAQYGNNKELVDSFLGYSEHCSRKQRAVLFYIIKFCQNQGNRIFPSQSYVSEKFGCCREYINRLFKKYEKLGFLISRRRPYQSSVYSLPIWLYDFDLKQNNLFAPTKPDYVNKNNVHKQSSCQGKSHNRVHKEDHTYKRTVIQEDRGKENVFVRSSFGSFQEPCSKLSMLEHVFISERDKKQLLRYSTRTIQRAIDDACMADKLQTIRNWTAALESRCQVYDMCENSTIQPKDAWAIYHEKQAQNKKNRCTK